jgi:hypothetical protein
MQFSTRRPGFASGGLLALLLLPLSVPAAQELPRKSEIRGIVLDAEARKPMVGVQVSLEGRGLMMLTDKKGRFKFSKLTEGDYLVRAEVTGFPTAVTPIQLARGERMEVEFMVGAESSGQVLPDLEVTSDAPRVSPIAEFNRRALEGNGRYITRPEIEKRRAANLMDLVRSVPGVRVLCPRNVHDCVLRLRRASCGPAYFLDGHPTDPSVLFLTLPSDVEGIEVYTGPSETPIELEGVRSGCGVVAIWTRVGERPRKP